MDLHVYIFLAEAQLWQKYTRKDIANVSVKYEGYKILESLVKILQSTAM